MPQMFQYELWSQSVTDRLLTVDDFIDGNFHIKKRKLNDKILLYAVCFSLVCTMCLLD